MVDLRKVIIAGIAIALVAQVIHSLGAFATMGVYLDPDYDGLWSRIMMPSPGPPPAEFYYISILFSLVSGLIFAFAYAFLQKAFPMNYAWKKKGLVFGLLIFLVAWIPGMLSTFLLFNVPLLGLISWTVEAFAVYLIGGIIAAKIIVQSY